MLILELRLGPWTRTLATQLAASLSDSDQAPGRIQVSDPNVSLSLGTVMGCAACSWARAGPASLAVLPSRSQALCVVSP